MSETLILSRADIAGLMTPADYLGAVEDAFRASASGQAVSPPPMHIPARRRRLPRQGRRATRRDALSRR